MKRILSATTDYATHIMDTRFDEKAYKSMNHILSGYIVCDEHRGGHAYRRPVGSLHSAGLAKKAGDALYRPRDLEECCRKEYQRHRTTAKTGDRDDRLDARDEMRGMLESRKVCEHHGKRGKREEAEEKRRQEENRKRRQRSAKREAERRREKREQAEARKAHASTKRKVERRKEDGKHPAGTKALYLLGSKFPLLGVFHQIAYMAFKDAVPTPVSLMPKKDQARYHKLAKRSHNNSKRRK